jgi:hypothetical protein
MRLRVNKKSGNEAGGAVLLVVICIAFVLAITIMGYMYLLSSQHKLVSRSMSWNTAMAMAEAGIEDGMAQLNVSFGTNYTGSAGTNWTFSNGAYGPKSASLNGGSYSAIIITTNGVCPSIIATGYAAVPYKLTPVKRVVQVDTTNWPPFGVAMAVLQDVDFKGNSIVIDSYDSADPSHSTNGMYDPAHPLATADCASLGGIVNVQNATIRGRLLTGPDGSYSLNSGTVGDLNWNVPGQVEPGWYRNDFNANFRDVDPPFNSGLPVAPVNLGTNTYVLTTGNYYVNGDFTINSGETLYITGNTRLYVTGNFTMKSQNASFITLAPGASLKLYVGTANGPAVATSLAQVNTSDIAWNAGSFIYYGLPSNTTIGWNGNASYVGSVYAPEATFTAGGGGSTPLDYQGACVVAALKLNGHFSFHYDENLKRSAPGTGFTVIAWREL